MFSNKRAFEVKNLQIAFNKQRVLGGVDFSLKCGEIHAVVGTNGAGKSTLMKILNGTYQRGGGSIKFFGEEVAWNSPQDAYKAGVAMVYQDLSLIPTLTIAQNVFLVNNPFRKGPFSLIDDKRAEEETGRIFEEIGIDTKISPKSFVGDISVGQQQLVEIAKALSGSPRVLILDEPTASLSNAEIKVLFGVLRRMREKGLSIIYITHYLNDISELCDSVTILRDGKTVRQSSVADLPVPQMIEDMLGTSSGDVSWKKTTETAEHGVPLLEVKNFSTPDINPFSLCIYPGQIVGIAGLLGSGRTEVLEALFGLSPALSGEVQLEGRTVEISCPTDAIKNGISLLPEDRRKQGLILDFSVSENIILSVYRRLTGLFLISQEKTNSLVGGYFNALGVKAAGVWQKVRFLSGGNQQKVVMAKCLATESRVLLLDDPTFGVDVNAKQEIMKIVRNYADMGNAVVFVSSEFDEIASFCDHVCVVRKRELASPIHNDGLTKEMLLQMVN